jgi:hypothetical protein
MSYTDVGFCVDFGLVEPGGKREYDGLCEWPRGGDAIFGGVDGSIDGVIGRISSCILGERGL